MAYQNGKTYYIVPIGNQGLALNLQGDGAIQNQRNVNIYTKLVSVDQQWVLRTYSGFARLLCKGNEAYGLDYYYGANNPGNCDINVVAGNEEDSKIDLRTIDAANNIYCLQSYRNNTNNDLYLTATSLSAGANVNWQARNTAINNRQQWKLIEVGGSSGGSTSKRLSMPLNVNQWYEKNNTDVKNYGCAMCCKMDVDAFNGYPYNASDIAAAIQAYYNANWINNVGTSWTSNYTTFSQQEGSFSTQTAAATIKAQIDAGQPVILRFIKPGTDGSGNQQHWIVAVGYNNSCASINDVIFFNPYNPIATSTIGRVQTWSEATSGFGGGEIKRIVTCAKR